MLGAAGIDPDIPFDDFSGLQGTVDVPPTGASQINISPLTIDHQADNVDDTVRLDDALGESYITTRVVGNIFIEREMDETDLTNELNGAGCIAVAAGIFVAREEDRNLVNPTGVSQPIGGVNQENAVRNYGPLCSANIAEPWMWRQTWLLGRGHTNARQTLSSGGGNREGSVFPMSNVYYNTPQATAIDIKSKRRIRKEERLWFVIQAKGVRFGPGEISEATNGTLLNFWTDLRLLGHMVRNSKRSVF